MSQPLAHFRVSWKVAAITLCVFALGLITALITIGFAKGVDALSTIALTLAVIAFIAQLIIFVLQTTQSGDQLREAQQLNTQTRELLSDVRTRVDTTYQMVSSHNDVMLKMAALKTETGAEHAEASSSVMRHGGGLGRESAFSKEARDRIREIATLPDPEALEPILNVLEGMPDGAIKAFSLNLGNHMISIAADDGSPDIVYGITDDPLIEAGYAEKYDSPSGVQVRLTDAGLRAGSVFAANWPLPSNYSHLSSRVLNLREKGSPTAISHMGNIRET